MKKQILYWMAAALCGTLTLASCSTDADELVVAHSTKQVSVTLTLPNGADTRTTFTENNDGDTFKGLKTTWEKGDKIVLECNESTVPWANLTMSKMSADGTTATFTGEIPEDWYEDLTETTEIKLSYSGNGSLEEQNGKLENLGNKDLLEAIVYLKNGKLELSDEGFQRKTSFVRLPQGTDVGYSGDIDIEFYGGYEQLIRTLNGTGWAEGGNGYHVEATANSEGKLTSDVYIAFLLAYGNASKVYMKIKPADSNDFTIYTINPSSTTKFEFEYGKMYTIQDLSQYKSVGIGMVVGADGKFYKDATAATAASTTARAMVAYLKVGITADIEGLAIALEDASSESLDWDNAKSTVSTWANSYKVNGYGFYWHLPSADDWEHMFQSCDGSDYMESLSEKEFSYGNFRTYLTAAGGTDVKSGKYWSSTEHATQTANAWIYNFNGQKFEYWAKSNKYNVRAVLTFHA